MLMEFGEIDIAFVWMINKYHARKQIFFFLYQVYIHSMIPLF